MSRHLLLQFARLGDLMQSLPVLSSLHAQSPDQPIDLLCAKPLVSLGALFPGVQQVYPWDGEQWRALACLEGSAPGDQVRAAQQYLEGCAFPPYSLAYNLNNHPRSILAAHLLSTQVIGAGQKGPLHPDLPPWVVYLQKIALERGENRIHLADAFCGICGVSPPHCLPTLEADDVMLPRDLEWLVQGGSALQIGVVLGAGDADRRVSTAIWREFIQACTVRVPHSRLLLIGGPGERETSLSLERNLPAQTGNQVINCCGRTNLPQLVSLLNHCQWVVGSDTGPLHLGVMCGAQAIGWYFSRARVHETGPYGEGHWAWQAKGEQQAAGRIGRGDTGVVPQQWPVEESVDLLAGVTSPAIPQGWSLWKSHRDRLGVFFSEEDRSVIPDLTRERVWRRMVEETARDWNVPKRVFEVSHCQGAV